MRRQQRHDTRTMADTGLNNSDVGAADADTPVSSSKLMPLTPLASFSADDLSRLRRTAPDAYHAVVQYEQLCRHNAALIEAKETELLRCIGVGQEVLGQLDQLQSRCSQLARERDEALEKAKALQQRARRCEGVLFCGEGSGSPAMAQVRPQSSEDLLCKQLRRCETEAKKSHLRAKELEKELQDQKLLHDSLKRDLQSTVQVARSAEKSREAAEAARRLAETSLAEMRLQMEEKERELAQHCQLRKPSVEALAAAAQFATMHNQLQEIVLYARHCCSETQQLSSAPHSQATRLRLPTTGSADVFADRNITAPQLEHWFAGSLEETAQLVLELSHLLHQMEERQRRCVSDCEAANQERRFAFDEAHGLRCENGRLREALVALKEEVQALDVQTDRLCEVNGLEARHRIAQRLVTEDEEEKRHVVEREIHPLHVKFARWRDEERCAASQAARVASLVSPPDDVQLSMGQQQRRLDARMEELGTENQGLRAQALQEVAGLRAEIARLEQDVEKGKSRCQRQVQHHEGEIEEMMRLQRELQRKLQEDESAADRHLEELRREMKHMDAVVEKLKGELLEARSDFDTAKRETVILRQRHETELAQREREMAAMAESSRERTAQLAAENAKLKSQLEQAQLNREAELSARAKDVDVATIAALNHELCEARIESAKLQDALHRSLQKTEKLTETTVSVDRYEQIETELVREREQTEALVSSLAASQAQVEELRAELDEQRRCVCDSLRLLPLDPAGEFARVASLLQTVSEKAAARIFSVFDEPFLTSFVSSPHDGTSVSAPQVLVESSTLALGAMQSTDWSPLTQPLNLSPPSSTSCDSEQQIENVEPGAGRTYSPPTLPLVDELVSRSTDGVWQHHAVVTAFSTALQVFLRDLAAAVEQVLLRPYTDLWKTLERLGCLFSASFGGSDNAPSSLDYTRGNNEGGNSGDNVTNRLVLTEEGSLEHQTNAEKDAMWVAVVSGIMDAYVDACAAVFQQLRRATNDHLRERDEALQRLSQHLNAASDDHVRRAVHNMAEREQELSARLETANAEVVAAQRIAKEAQTTLEDTTSRYHEVCTRVEHLEERLASKQREWETEREQWCDTVNRILSKCGAQRQNGEEQRGQLRRRVEELQEELQATQEKLQGARVDERRIQRDADDNRAAAQREIRRLERELEEARASQCRAGQTLREIHDQLAASNVALQQKQNNEMSRSREAEKTIEVLQQELRELRAAQQALQRSLAAEERRSEAADSHSKELSRLLAEQRAQTEVLEQRVSELQEACQLQQKTLDVEMQETEALRNVNRVLEERLSEVEGDREPLRQQLQSLLMLQPQ